MKNVLRNIEITNKKQQGATLLGMMFVGGLVAMVLLVGVKIFPAYQQFFSVKSVIRAMKQESLSSMSKAEIIKSFDKRADIGYVTAIAGKDLEITKGADGDTVVTARYQVVTPIVGNISALMDFQTSTDAKL